MPIWLHCKKSELRIEALRGETSLAKEMCEGSETQILELKKDTATLDGVVFKKWHDRLLKVNAKIDRYIKD